jgi:hypothetical protein
MMHAAGQIRTMMSTRLISVPAGGNRSPLTDNCRAGMSCSDGWRPLCLVEVMAQLPTGTVLVDARRCRLVGNLLEQRSLCAVDIKGFTGRQRVWQTLGRSRVLSRFEALRSRATPLVGREELS